MSLKHQFSQFAQATATAAGHYATFIAAVALIAGWAASGPIFQFSNTWQLVINTGTTIITFLMVFLIQHTQNHDSRAIHLKLDGIIAAIEDVPNQLIVADEDSEDRLDQTERQFKRLARE